MKKHRQQMKPREIAALEARIRLVCGPRINGHAIDRMQDKGITAREITNAILYGQVIEIHNEHHGTLRVVVRHEYGKPRVAVCVVVALEDGYVATTWKNRAEDKHSTLDLSAYTWRVDVETLLQAKAISNVN